MKRSEALDRAIPSPRPHFEWVPGMQTDRFTRRPQSMPKAPSKLGFLAAA